MPIKAQTGPRYSSGPFLTCHEQRQYHVSAALLPEKRGLDCTRGRSGGHEKFRIHRNSILDRTANSELLYGLRYSDRQARRCLIEIWTECLVFSPFGEITRIVKLSHDYFQIFSNSLFNQSFDVFQCPMSHSSLTLQSWPWCTVGRKRI